MYKIKLALFHIEISGLYNNLLHSNHTSISI